MIPYFTIDSIVRFVENVCDSSNAEYYVPIENRIAVFDMFALSSSNEKYKNMCVLLNHDSLNCMEADYNAYDTTKRIYKDWSGWAIDTSTLWDSTVFDTILTNHNWHKMNMSEVFIKDLIFVKDSLEYCK